MDGTDDPFAEIEELVEQLTDFGATLSGETPVDVLDTDEAVVVHADLPGRDPDTLQVQLQDDNTLRIEATPREEESEGRYVVRERHRDAVSRDVRLPAAVDEGATEASYEAGVLTVRLGKPSESDGTDIPVN